MLACVVLAGAAHRACAGPAPDPVPPADVADRESSRRADARYEEMLSRMQASIEDIAQMYGNPTFLQVFTNDAQRAAELKERLHAATSSETIEKALQELTQKRDKLMDDIALKEREAARLTKKLALQRAALDAVAGAIDQARRTVEDTSK